MKSLKLQIQLSLVLFLTFLLINYTNANTNENVSSSSHYTESEAKIFTKFSKLAACASKPLNEKCPKCINPGNGYKFYFFYQTTRINKFNYKFMIHYNDILKKILVTFSGPSVKEHVYIKYIYSAGFSLVKKYRFQVEKEYYEIYFNKLRKILKQKLLKVRSSGRSKFQTYFTGHSIGGSLATLAAFDMQQSKVINKVKVFSLAPLRLGDATFVAMVNAYVTVYRVVKKSDYLVRIPNCYYSTTYKMWRCFNEKIVKEFILKPSFPLKIYVGSYLTYYRKTNPILRAAIVYARKRMSHKKTHLKKNKNSKKNKKNKKAISKRKSKAQKGKKHKPQKKHSSKKSKRAKKMKKNANSMKKLLKKLNQKVQHSEKTLKKFNPKKIQKSSKKIAKQLKKLKKKNVGKISLKKIKKLIKNSKKLNKRKLKKKPSLLKKKMKRFFKRVKHMAKRIFKKAEKLFLKGEAHSKKTKRKNKISHKKNKKHRKTKKGKKSKKTKKSKMAKKHKKPKNAKKLKKVKKTKGKKKISPIKKLANKNKTKSIVQKSYTFIPSKFKVYTPLQTYFTFVYYTQPIGYQIFYNDAMTEYTTCQYVNEISLCEKVVALPLQFTIAGHMTYFGIDFNKC